jgi:peroxiredoxin
MSMKDGAPGTVGQLAGIGRAALVALGLALVGVACHRQPSCDVKDRAKLDFTVKDMNGATVSLAAFRGRPLVLNFWATWCGPCKEEIPALISLAEKYKASHLAILGISVDDPPADLQKFATANKVNYPLLVGLGHDELLEAYDAELAVPVSWFVASNGCVATRHPGTASKDWLDAQMKALL